MIQACDYYAYKHMLQMVDKNTTMDPVTKEILRSALKQAMATEYAPVTDLKAEHGQVELAALHPEYRRKVIAIGHRYGENDYSGWRYSFPPTHFRPSPSLPNEYS